MYLVICENKYGLSIESYNERLLEAKLICKRLNSLEIHGNKYHLRKFDLESIDLEKLIKEGE